MPVGRYEVISEWRNHNNTLDVIKVGYSYRSFNIIHNVTIQAVEPTFKKIVGEPLVIKVRFIDNDLNSSIPYANINFNSSYGEQGFMAYAGSGVYVADIDTSELNPGLYYFSFNSSNEYYENLTGYNLMSLEIVLDQLNLEVSHQVTTAMANSFAIFQFNVSGEQFGVPISTPNITTDWYKNYTITEHSIGNYTLNISTFEVTSGDIPETFTITISANKTDYGTSTDVVIVTVYPVPTLANINVSIVQASLNQNFTVKVNYTTNDTQEIIEEANCSVYFASVYQISEFNGEFIIEFNTTELILENKFVQIKLEHPGYKTAYQSFNLLIIPTIAELQILHVQPIEIFNGDTLNLSCRYHSEGVDIKNASISLLGDIAGEFVWNGSNYIYHINTSQLNIKSYFVQILASATNYQSQFKETLITVSKLTVAIDMNTTIIDYQPGTHHNIYLTVYDLSHNKVTTDLRVTYEYGGSSGDLLLQANSSFLLEPHTLNLSPNKQVHLVKITVINPYGDNSEMMLTILTPGLEIEELLGLTLGVANANSSSNNFLRYNIILALMGFGIIITLSGIIIKRRYFNLTKLQRKIKKVKHYIQKDQFKKVPHITRENVIAEIINEKIIHLK